MAFLVGHPRSGTTFLGRALGSHPGVGYWEEPRLLFRARQDFDALRPVAEHLVADSSVDELWRTERDGNLREQFGIGEDAETEGVCISMVRQRVFLLRGEFLSRSGGALLLDKTPRQLRALSDAASWFPEARVVHIVRDGRDVAASAVAWERRWGRPGWLDTPGPVVAATAQQWATDVQEALAASPKATVVRYEDLVADGRMTVRRVLDHLALPWHPGVGRFLAEGMDGLHARSVGRWREDLAAGEVDLVVGHAGALLADLGYAS